MSEPSSTALWGPAPSSGESEPGGAGEAKCVAPAKPHRWWDRPRGASAAPRDWVRLVLCPGQLCAQVLAAGGVALGCAGGQGSRALSSFVKRPFICAGGARCGGWAPMGGACTRPGGHMSHLEARACALPPALCGRTAPCPHGLPDPGSDLTSLLQGPRRI